MEQRLRWCTSETRRSNLCGIPPPKSEHVRGPGVPTTSLLTHQDPCLPCTVRSGDLSEGSSLCLVARHVGILFRNVTSFATVSETFFVERDHGLPAEGSESFNTTRWTIVMQAAHSQAQGAVRFRGRKPMLPCSVHGPVKSATTGERAKPSLDWCRTQAISLYYF